MPPDTHIKMYKVKEIYYTLQGEGYHSGRAAIFCRFSGCNLWSGREEDRGKAICQFCDTDFWGTDGENGGHYTATALVDKCISLWPKGIKYPFVVLTGGEPMLQLDTLLLDTFHSGQFEVAIESNGTIALIDGIDWVCISPKAYTDLVVKSGDELKLVYPQENQDPKQFTDLDFKHFYLQPMDSEDLILNTQAAIQYCHVYPQWKLSLQTHKILGLR